MLLSSCVEPYYAGGELPHPDGPRIIEREPVVVERYHHHVEEQPRVVVEQYRQRQSYPDTYRQERPIYGDPVPGTTYRRTTTRTYQDY